MAYYRGKDIEKSRGNAIQEVILEKRSIAQLARRFSKNIKFIDRKPNRVIRYYNYDRIYLGIGLKLLMKCCAWGINSGTLLFYLVFIV